MKHKDPKEVFLPTWMDTRIPGIKSPYNKNLAEKLSALYSMRKHFEYPLTDDQRRQLKHRGY